MGSSEINENESIAASGSRLKNVAAVEYRELTAGLKSLTGVIQFLITLTAFIYALRLDEYFGVSIYVQQVVAFILGLVLVLNFLMKPAGPRSAARIPWYDWILALLSLVATGYIVIRYPAIVVRVTNVPVFEYVAGILAILLVAEAVRRHCGWPMLAIAGFFVVQAIFTNFFPGFMYGKGTPALSVIESLYTGSNAVFGTVLQVMAVTVLIFVLLGEVVNRGGGMKIFMDAAAAVAGRYRGGPAKAAVIASSAFGSVNGSSGANTAVVGVFTIPLMKKTGYSSVFAGAIEAAASSFGCLMPPIMGTVAFVMAQYLDLPYGRIVEAAILPAVLFYIGILSQIDLRAGKIGLKGMPSSSLPPLWPSLRAGWWIAPPIIFLLILILYFQTDITMAGIYTFLCFIAISLFRKQGKIGLKSIVASFQGTARSMLMIIPIGALAGIFVGALSVSGLGISLSQELVSIAGGHQVVLLIVLAFACFILGMGMPVIAVYIMLVLLLAPALAQTGISLLGAHFFVFYYATISFITPPVAVCAYVAASIAKASPFRIGFQAMRLSIVTLVIPFVFVYQPALLMDGQPVYIVIDFLAAAVGVYFLAVMLEGYLFQNVSWLWRGLFGMAGLSLMSGHTVLQITGLIIGALAILWEGHRKKATAGLQA